MIRRTSQALLLVLLAGACSPGQGGDEPPDTAGEVEGAGTAEEGASGPDPCTLVSSAEMEALIGPLGEPPYRVDSDRVADPSGEGCFYRAADGRNVTIGADWESGPMVFQMMAGNGEAIGDILFGYDASTDTLEGEWDKIGTAFGLVIALEDSVSVTVDPLGSRIGLPGAVHLVDLAVGRVHAPLPYDGSKATRARPAERMVERNPCDLVTRQEAEALMGPLREDPRPSEDGAGCDFVTVESMGDYPVTFTLSVQWKDGFYALGREKAAIGGATRAMAAHMDPDIPELSEQAAGEAEPWDERVTLLGGLIAVVKSDAMLGIAAMGWAGFEEPQALELLRIAASRL